MLIESVASSPLSTMLCSGGGAAAECSTSRAGKLGSAVTAAVDGIDAVACASAESVHPFPRSPAVAEGYAAATTGCAAANPSAKAEFAGCD